MYVNKFGLYLIFVFSTCYNFAQQANAPLSKSFGTINDKVWNAFENDVHTGLNPVIPSFYKLKKDSLKHLSDWEKAYYLNHLTKTDLKGERSWLVRKMFFENLIMVDTQNFYLTIDPLLNFEYGNDLEDTSATNKYVNTRGFLIKGNIGKQVAFMSNFYETQAVLPQYLTEFVSETGVMPGQGRVKDFKGKGVDFGMASAYVSYSPGENLNFQLGTDKHFIGDGYRSLLLSDVAFNYPYLKGTVYLFKKKLQYTKIHAVLQNLNRLPKGSTPESLFERKTVSWHYLNYIVNKWLHIGLFESTVWQRMDSTGTLPFNYQQINPIIGINTLTTGFNSNNSSQVGINYKIKTPIQLITYGQYIYGGGNQSKKRGYQVGIKYLGLKNTYFLIERNTVQPFTYSAALPLQSYTHNNQPLAHPIGANFNEWVGIIRYHYKRLFVLLKANQIEYNTLGNDILLPEYTITSGAAKTTVDIKNFEIGYELNPKNHLHLLFGMLQRTENNNSTQNTNYIYFGLKTSIRNLYYDF